MNRLDRNREIFNEISRYGELIKDDRMVINGADVRVMQFVWIDTGCGFEYLADVVKVNGEVVSCVIS